MTSTVQLESFGHKSNILATGNQYASRIQDVKKKTNKERDVRESEGKGNR
jgi:hypothetical protein